MTKLKSKKITKSTIAIIIMGIAIVALLAFGGTFAYFTTTSAEQTVNFTTGSIRLSSSEVTITNPTRALPGDVIIDADVIYTSTVDVKTIVIVKYSVTNANAAILDAAVNTASGGFTQIQETKTENSGATAVKYYYAVIDVTEGTSTSVAKTFIDGPVSIPTNLNTDYTGDTLTNGYTNYEGIDISFSFQARSIQYRNLPNTVSSDAAVAVAAANELFSAGLTPIAE